MLKRNLYMILKDKYRLQYPILKGGKFYRIDCKLNYELIRELTSFGKELLVIEPTEVQNAVWEKIHSMNNLYQELRT